MDIGIAVDGFDDLETVAAAVQVLDPAPSIGGAETVASADMIFVSGLASARKVVAAGGEQLCVLDRPEGLTPMAISELDEAVEAIGQEAYDLTPHRPLHVQCAGEELLGLERVMVMTIEPATITEYAIRCQDESVCRFRADGTVFASPTGSGGYQRSAGGPILDPSVEGIAITPIAPYRTDPDHWVLGGTIVCEVLREAGTVGLFIDGEEVRDIPVGETLTIKLGAPYRSVRTTSSRSPYHR